MNARFPAALAAPTSDLVWLDAATLDRVVEYSRRSPRGRMIAPFHKNEADPLHRMLNAIQPHSYVRPHRHLDPPKAEAWVVVRGAVAFFTFEEDGAIRDCARIGPGEPCWGVDLVPGVYHGLVALEPDTVLYEVKTGPYAALTDKAFAPFAPLEGTPEADTYRLWLLKAFEERQPAWRPAQLAAAGAHEHFPGFEPFSIATSGATIHGVKGGQGPALLLLHGWPQSHLEWRVIAPWLARDFSVIATDLRGYGQSSKPADGAGHVGYSKREMARDQVEVMQALGHTRFAVVGHDRGGRVAHRMALDHRERVERLAVIDIVPTLKLYSDMKKEFATAYFHWFLMLAPAPVPETLLSNSAEFMLRGLFGGVPKGAIPEPIFAEYLRAFKDPATMHAMCEDYRAAASIDLEHDRADLASKLACPLLTLWGEKGAMHPLYDVTATWRERADHVRGKALPGGHWLPEELPEATYAELHAFLVGR